MQSNDSLSVIGLSESIPYELRLIPQNLQESVDVVLMLPRVVELARAFCPVLTGALRDSIRVERPGALRAKVVAGGSTVNYARHIHDGTSSMPARPFLLQALIAERPKVARDILMGAVQ